MDKTFDRAQELELQFWERHQRTVRANFADPRDYVRHRIRDTLEVRGMTIEDFRGKSVIEYGPGMYPMVSVLPTKKTATVEPLIKEFMRIMNNEEFELWKKSGVNCYSRGEDYHIDRNYDYCLLKNVLDHTTRPADLVANIRADVVLVDSFVGRDENEELHPSAFSEPGQVKELFAGYKCTFEHEDKERKLWYFTFNKGETNGM